MDGFVKPNELNLTISEVEAILEVPEIPSLAMLDNTLRMFVTFCAGYHGMSWLGWRKELMQPR